MQELNPEGKRHIKDSVSFFLLLLYFIHFAFSLQIPQTHHHLADLFLFVVNISAPGFFWIKLNVPLPS